MKNHNSYNSLIQFSLTLYKKKKYLRLEIIFAYDKLIVTKTRMGFCSGMVRKHGGNRRKCWLPAFSPFPIMFSKDLFHNHKKKIEIFW